MKCHECGEALLVSLLLVLSATLLGVAGITTSILQERIAANQKQIVETYMAAETGIAAAVDWLDNVDDGCWNDIDTCRDEAIAAIHADYDTQLSATVFWQIVGLDFTPPTASGDPIVVTIRSRGSAGDTRRLVEVEYRRDPFPVPPFANADSAMTCYGAGCNIVLRGTPELDGSDWGVPEDFDCGGASASSTGCRNAMLASNLVIPGLYLPDGGTYTTTGASTIVGEPSPVVTELIEGAMSVAQWEAYLASLEAYTPQTFNGTNPAVLGTRTSPAFAQIVGDITVGSGIDGAGLLVVRAGGKLTLSGNSHYEGMIILENGAGLEMAAGTPMIYGTIVMLQNNTAVLDDEAAYFLGNALVRHSQVAVANVGNIHSGFVSRNLESWHEVIP